MHVIRNMFNSKSNLGSRYNTARNKTLPELHYRLGTQDISLDLSHEEGKIVDNQSIQPILRSNGSTNQQTNVDASTSIQNDSELQEPDAEKQIQNIMNVSLEQRNKWVFNYGRPVLTDQDVHKILELADKYRPRLLDIPATINALTKFDQNPDQKKSDSDKDRYLGAICKKLINNEYAIKIKKDTQDINTTVCFARDHNNQQYNFALINSKIIHPDNINKKYKLDPTSSLGKHYAWFIKFGRGSYKYTKLCYSLAINPSTGAPKPAKKYVRLIVNVSNLGDVENCIREVFHANKYTTNRHIQPLILGTIYKKAKHKRYQVELFSELALCNLSHFPEHRPTKITNRILTQQVAGIFPNFYLDIFRQLSLALYSFHADDYAHADIKPENILVFYDANKPHGFLFKLTDFGGCHHIDECFTPSTTYQYLSPEAWELCIHSSNPEIRACYTKTFRSQKQISLGMFIFKFFIDHISHTIKPAFTLADDVFAMGVSMFELITGDLGLDKNYSNQELAQILFNIYDKFPLLEVFLAPTRNAAITISQALDFINVQENLNLLSEKKSITKGQIDTICYFVAKEIMQCIATISCVHDKFTPRFRFYHAVLSSINKAAYQPLTDELLKVVNIDDLELLCDVILPKGIESNRNKVISRIITDENTKAIDSTLIHSLQTMAKISDSDSHSDQSSNDDDTHDLIEAREDMLHHQGPRFKHST